MDPIPNRTKERIDNPDYRIIDYEDGSRNKVWDEPGVAYDFRVGGSRAEGLLGTDPRDAYAITVVHDQVELPFIRRYVLFNGGVSAVRFDTNDATRITVPTLLDGETALKLTNKLLEKPRAIGERPGFLGGGKLTAVMELMIYPGSGNESGWVSYPVSDEVVGKKNPLMYAHELYHREFN